MDNEQKLAAAKEWMRSRGIEIKAGGWRGPSNPLPNLANVQPTIECHDCGIIGQWRALVRMMIL